MCDRYAHLDAQADCGLGAEEPDIRRFTRRSEMTVPPVHPAKNVTEGEPTTHIEEK